MASLDSILSRYVTESDGHVNSLQGAAFIVTDKNGTTISTSHSQPFPLT